MTTTTEQLTLPDVGTVRFGPSTIKPQKEEAMTTEAPTHAISLTLPELQALQKTVGIALANVGRKASVLAHNSPARAEALQDYRHLQSINAELSLILSEEIN